MSSLLYSPIFRIFLMTFCLYLFLFLRNEKKVLVVFFSLFLSGLIIDFGIQIDPLKIILLAFAVCLIFRLVKIDPRSDLASTPYYFKWFLIYSFSIWFIGYLILPTSPSNLGIARGSTLKPIVQLCSFCLNFFLLIIPLKWIKTKTDAIFFLKNSKLIVLLIASIGIFQEVYFQFFKRAPWGYLNGTGTTISQSYASISHWNILRVNGFSWEPKSFGITLFVSTVIFLIQPKINKIRGIFYFFIISSALFISFSATTFAAIIMSALFSTFIYLQKNYSRNNLKYISFFIVFSIFFILIAPFITPTIKSFYEFRGKKAFDLFFNTKDSSYGSDKEKPALLYINENPWMVITGVGLGSAPFYYEKYVTASEGSYQEPDIGLIWLLYSFGLIGSFLFVAGAYKYMKSFNLENHYLYIPPLCICVFVSSLLSHRTVIPMELFLIGFLLSNGFKEIHNLNSSSVHY